MNGPTDGTWIRLLGPVEVWVDGRLVELGPPRERCVLAALAVDAGRVVSVETLIDRVWGHAPPARTRNTLYVYVARLRQRLAGALEISRRSRGYLLDIDPDRIDVHRFRGLVARADDRLAPLRDAVRLWDGEPMADLTSDWATQARSAWQQERLDAVVVWARAELVGGNAATTVAVLTELADRYPLAESVVAALMHALHASGRSADALDRYRRCRDRLVEELGVDPGQRLQEAHQTVLRGEDARGAAREPRGVRPAQLPLDVAGFVGRAAELRRLDELAASVVILWGTAGVGKTALAVRWAHSVRDRFPDGQLHVNLRGFDPGGAALSPEEAVRDFLDACGVPPKRVPAGIDAQVGLYRSLLDGRRMLVLLDNARDAEQVRPLLPGAPGCLAVVTSRNQLTSLVAAEGATAMPVDLLDADEASELLSHRVGATRVAAEPEMVQTIVAECARLPLALAVVGARAAARPDLPLAVLAAQLGDSALGALTAGDARTTVQTVFSWSYQALTPEAARLFRLLGLHPGPDWAAQAVASLAGVTVAQAVLLLSELSNAHLTTEHRSGRWTSHDLLRAYTRELVAGTDSEVALRRMLDHYLLVADAAALSLNPQRDPITPLPAADGVVLDLPTDARQWFTTELPVLRALVPLAARAGFDTHAWQLARSMTTYLNHRGLWSELADLHTEGLAAARRVGDRDGQIHTLRDLALALSRRGAYEEAHAYLSTAAELCAEVKDDRKWVHTHRDLAELAGNQNRVADAIHHLELAAAVPQTVGSLGNTAGMLGWYYGQVGDYEQAMRHCKEALEFSEKAGDRWNVAGTCHTLGYIHHQLREYRQALSCYQQALDIVTEVGDLYRQAETLDTIAETHTAIGDTAAAANAHKRAQTIRQEFDQSTSE